MTIAYDASHRGWPQGSTHGAVCLQDKFEVLKDIGDGSFGSVALARVRTAGAHVARRGTLVSLDCFITSLTCVADVILGCHQDDEEDF